MKKLILGKRYVFIFLFSFLGISVFSQNEMSGELFDLAKIKNGVRNRRISSYDRTGGNADFVPGIKPGEKRTIAEISGKGVINHIWITSPTLWGNE